MSDKTEYVIVATAKDGSQRLLRKPVSNDWRIDPDWATAPCKPKCWKTKLSAVYVAKEETHYIRYSLQESDIVSVSVWTWADGELGKRVWGGR